MNKIVSWGAHTHAGHIAVLVILALFIASLVRHRVAPRGNGPGPLDTAAVVTGLVVGGAWLLSMAGRKTPPAPAPAPAPAPHVVAAPPKVIVHTVQAHPFMTGWQFVVLIGICAVVILGGLGITWGRGRS